MPNTIFDRLKTAGEKVLTLMRRQARVSGSHFKSLLVACVALAGILSTTTAASGQDPAADLLGTMYWSHRDEGVYRAARDGSDLKLLVPAKLADGLAIDQDGKTIYWMARDAGSIKVQKARLDGTGVVDLVTGLSQTGDLLLDAEAGKLYVSLMNEGTIIQLGTDDSQRTDFVVGLKLPDELALDPKHRTLYCTCSGDGTIQQIKLDDPKPRTILTTQGCWFGMAIDTSADQLYCVQSSRGQIYRAGLDGSDAKQIMSGLTEVDGLAIDIDNQKLYWTERGKISQANLDGSNIELLVAGKTAQYGSIVVLPPKD
jgi:sugar lactone lactonase YvrE